MHKLLIGLLVSVFSTSCERTVSVGLAPYYHPPADTVAQCTTQCATVGLPLDAVVLTGSQVHCSCRVGGPSVPQASFETSPPPPASP